MPKKKKNAQKVLVKGLIKSNKLIDDELWSFNIQWSSSDRQRRSAEIQDSIQILSLLD